MFALSNTRCTLKYKLFELEYAATFKALICKRLAANVCLPTSGLAMLQKSSVAKCGLVDRSATRFRAGRT
jgi:hypothetical protein